MKKKTAGSRFLQEAFYHVARFVALPFFSCKFNITADREPVMDGPYVVVANHVTELDFVFIAKVFRTPLSFVVGSGLLQNKFLNRILVNWAGCIAKQKGAADARTTMTMLRRLQSGRNVCLFAEGNTTFDGLTGPMNPATGGLLRAVRAGLVTCRIEGGYFALPRWGRGIRRGRTACRVVNTYSRETLQGMSAEAINQALENDLFEDAYKRQAEQAVPYKGRNKAEGLEHALYLCPVCAAFNTLRGAGDRLACAACGTSADFSDLDRLTGGFPFDTVKAWTAWQKSRLAERLAGKKDEAIVSDEHQVLQIQDEDGGLRLYCEGKMMMNADTLAIGSFRVPLLDIAGFEIYRKNIVQFTLRDGRHFQTGPKDGFNALKYRDLLGIIRESEE